MAKTVADVMNIVKEAEVKFVDFRFTDTRGKEQHVTVPVSAFGEDKFSGGHAFDGSSIAGWKGIEASDMLLMPDPNTANIDPFFEEPTLILTCDVVEPGDGKPYERDPRSLAKRAEAYMKASGLGDTAYFGPEPEFFIFDSVRWQVDMSGCFCKIESEEASWNSESLFALRLPRRSRAATSTDSFRICIECPDPALGIPVKITTRCEARRSAQVLLSLVGNAPTIAAANT
jgi:glutamine synthetase